MDGNASRSVTNIPVINPADVFTTTTKAIFLGTHRTRIGIASGNGLFYATGGLAVGSFKLTDSFGAFGNTSIATSDTTVTRLGWTVGGGLEWSFPAGWSAKIEYLYVDFGTKDTSIPSCAICAPGNDIPVHHRLSENIARLGINKKF
jgi:outer membrane immunogenic protein